VGKAGWPGLFPDAAVGSGPARRLPCRQHV
jgi:hypothetical protein